ncbi:fibronectin type III domain-containing protein [Gorillibacterium massiliense]|uniref:fibronectin type III domain-containing protein n=1 Tax=Gorillibacterium massiliense TaxID=1280390 RepID=UPI0004B25A50|nr:PA14 domain-containing protein [Gorillibacterium massiliense]
MKRTIMPLLAKIICFVMFLSWLLPLAAPPVFADSPIHNLTISFQSPDVPLEDHALPDYGEVYGERNGYTYGWNFDHTDNWVSETGSSVAEMDTPVTETDTPVTETDNSVAELDSSVSKSVYGAVGDTAIQVQSNGTWELELPNGTYKVSVSVGSAVYGSDNTLFAEDTLLWDHHVLSAGEEDTIQKTVSVKDGKLTLRGTEASDQTYIRQVTVDPVLPVTSTMELPYIGLPAVQNKVPGNKIILSGTQSNVHNALPSIKVDGLQNTIGDYLNAQLQSLDQLLRLADAQAVSSTGSDALSLQASVQASTQPVVYLKTGYLNLDSPLTLGTPEKPVFLIADGMNVNRNLAVTIYGALIVKGDLNGNSGLSLSVLSPNSTSMISGGNLWVQGAVHLNNESTVRADGDFAAGDLIYNNGTLTVGAKRLIVKNSMHINTNVQMDIEQEMLVGSLISNNNTAIITVQKGDLFVRDELHVNSHLDFEVGGVLAVGGNMNANTLPIVHTGTGTNGYTKLKYTSYGLKAEYYSESNLNGERITSLDPQVDLNLQSSITSPGLDDGSFSVRWTGFLTARYSETYRFTTDVKGGVRLWVNGVLLIDQWSAGNGDHRYTGELDLEAGIPYEIQMEYADFGGQPKAALYWESDSEGNALIPQNQLKPFAAPVVSTSPSSSDMTLIWSPVFNADGYEVEADGGIYSLANVNAFVHGPLDSGTEHGYRIRANGGDIKGDWSGLTDIWTLPGIPQNIRIQSGSSSVELVWDEVTGATGYDIETNNTVIDNGNITSYTEKNLNPNMQRTFRIRAKNSSGPGAWSSVVAKSTLPGTAGSLRAVPDDTSISLTWDAVSGAESYDLEVDGTVVTGIAGTQYMHGGLASNTTHTYRIKSVNREGASEWSGSVTATTLPSIPLNLRATAGSSNISVAWDEVAGATGYDIEVDGAVLDNGSGTTYLHSGLSTNAEHTYRVRAKNGPNIGKWSASITRTTLSDVPTNLRAAVTSKEISLTWDPVIGATGYEVEADGKLTDVGLNTTFVHKNLLPFTDHRYRVRAHSRAGTGEWSSYLSASTGLDKPQLAVAAITQTSISLTWSSVSGATRYELMIDGETIDAGTGTSYLHAGLLPYSWHAYRVRAVSDGQTGEWSEALTQSTALATPVITGIKATSRQIAIEWDEVVGATGYEVEADNAVIDAGSSSIFVHNGLLPNTIHTYRVRAKNASVTSEWSQWSTSRTLTTTPDTPGNLRATATTNSISLQWNSVKDADNYDLEIDGKVVSAITRTEYLYANLDANTMHTFRVRASNHSGKSDWSEMIKERTTPEMTVNVGQDTIFNFVVVASKQEGLSERLITVTYDPDELEVLDLCAATPDRELKPGKIEGTNLTVVEHANGKIVFSVTNATKTTVNIIRFLAKSNEDSKITYTVD